MHHAGAPSIPLSLSDWESPSSCLNLCASLSRVFIRLCYHAILTLRAPALLFQERLEGKEVFDTRRPPARNPVMDQTSRDLELFGDLRLASGVRHKRAVGP
jgi:hypothetical protein